MQRLRQQIFAIVLLPLAGAAAFCEHASAAEPINIGSRLELMVDNCLIDKMTGASLVLHQPVKREIAIEHNSPWEGNNCGYHTVFQDGNVYRMYYMVAHNDCGKNEVRPEPATHQLLNAYAESKDGIHWTKPELGQFEFAGSKKNNILTWDSYEKNTECVLAPFKDANPNCKSTERYKALHLAGGGLWTAKSADGIHWSRLSDKAVITEGTFDSLNLAFWDAVRGEYRAFFRGFRDGRRDILTATSHDFVSWSKPVWIEYPGSPPQELYTNQIAPYYRAPHFFLGFPTRYVDRGWTPSHDALSELEHRRQRAKMTPRFGSAITDGLFMSSRDGATFKRWSEAFLRPGPQELNHWIYGDQYQNWGLVETKSDLPGAPNELSMYAIEGCWRGVSDRLRRYTIRIDGFVSLQAPLAGGECVTKPVTFSGKTMAINYSTSAAGDIRVEIQDVNGKPLDGFRLEDCPEVFGDSLERTVSWKAGNDLGKLAGRPVRLRFVIKDADLFSFQFK
jgi:hypothetical protein